MPQRIQRLTMSRPGIYIAGNQNPRLSADLVKLDIEETLAAPARCRAIFNNVSEGPDGQLDYTYFDLNDFSFGSDLSIFVGVPPNTLYGLFHGSINLIAAQYHALRAPTIVIEGEDALQALRMKVRTRTFEQVTDQDIIQQIAGEYGLSTDINLDSPVHARLEQLNQSDLAFVLDRVRACAGLMWVEANKLIVKKEADTLANPQELEYGAALKQFFVQGDLRTQCTSVGLVGWDIRSKSAIRQTATDAVLTPDITGKTGSRTLEEAFGQRLQAFVHDIPESDEEAEHLAASYYREKAEQFITGTGLAEPLPGLHVGRILAIRGVGKLFEGAYVVSRVRHRFDTSEGLRTDFDVRRAWLGEIRQTTKENNDAGKKQRNRRKSVAR